MLYAVFVSLMIICEQVSQINVMRLLPTLSIFCNQNVPFYSALFL